MIIFDGTKEYNGITILIFKNEFNKKVEITLDHNTARYFIQLLNLLNTSSTKPFDVELSEDT